MKKLNLNVGLVNPKSPTNVGSVMRAAGCYQVDSVFYTGRRYARAAKFHTDTNNATNKIALVAVEDICDEISDSTSVVCIELVEGAIALPEFKHPDDAIYIFGPEDGTISQELVDRADSVVYIPTVGCMNLAATVNVVLYDRLAKSTIIESGDALIRSSRDRNNSVKVTG